ncbi:MAG: hypothetical protein MUE78_09950, partial [Ilumatobacteraceae bacterium]|nr:hypothetical protein [Ilumatobacteraceae bacterium]
MSVRAVAMLARAPLRGERGRTAAVVCLVAVVSAAVLASLIGLHRTSTAVERATAAFGGDWDAIVQQTGPPATDRLRSLPIVAEAGGITFAFAFPEDFPSGVNPFAGSVDSPYFDWIVEGRSPDPVVAGEFVANRGFLELTGVEVGDRVPFRYLDDSELAGVVDATVGSPLIGTLVGVVGGPGELENPAPTVIFSPAFLDLDVAVVATITAVRLESGATLEELRSEVEAIEGIDDRFLASGEVVGPATRTSVRLQTTAVSIVAALMSVAGVATVVQLLRRHRARREHEVGIVRSLGLTWGEHVAVETWWSAGVTAAGAAVGAVLALPLSLVFPVGFVRRLDPDVGSVVAPWWLPVSGAVAMVAVVAMTVATLVRLDRRRRPRRSGPSAATTRLRIGSPAAVGARAVLAPTGRRPLPSLIAIGLCLTGVVGGLLFWSSLGRLVDDAARWGESWDYLVDSSFLERPIDAAAAADDPALAAATVMADAQAVVDGRDVELIAVDPVRGELLPVVLAGRMPEG